MIVLETFLIWALARQPNNDTVGDALHRKEFTTSQECKDFLASDSFQKESLPHLKKLIAATSGLSEEESTKLSYDIQCYNEEELQAKIKTLVMEKLNKPNYQKD